MIVEGEGDRETPRVLVVEDSPEQAQSIAALFEEVDYAVELAGTLPDAVRLIEQEHFDLVVTRGLLDGTVCVEVVTQIRERSSHLPIVVLTDEGEGEAAAEALRAGAASYVPKARQHDELIATVDSVLAVALEEKGRNRILRKMKTFHLLFELENEKRLVGPLVRFLQEAVSAVQPAADEGQLTQLGMALQEALVNAMVHGNLEVGSEVRVGGAGEWHRLIQERLHQSHYADRRVYVDFRFEHGEVTCKIDDEGPGFDLGLVPDPTDPANLLKVSGRGLFLINSFMDDVHHNAAGNSITLRKRLGRTGRAVSTH